MGESAVPDPASLHPPPHKHLLNVFWGPAMGNHGNRGPVFLGRQTGKYRLLWRALAEE